MSATDALTDLRMARKRLSEAISLSINGREPANEQFVLDEALDAIDKAIELIEGYVDRWTEGFLPHPRAVSEGLPELIDLGGNISVLPDADPEVIEAARQVALRRSEAANDG